MSDNQTPLHLPSGTVTFEQEADQLRVRLITRTGFAHTIGWFDSREQFDEATTNLYSLGDSEIVRTIGRLDYFLVPNEFTGECTFVRPGLARVYDTFTEAADALRARIALEPAELGRPITGTPEQVEAILRDLPAGSILSDWNGHSWTKIKGWWSARTYLDARPLSHERLTVIFIPDPA